MDLIDKFREDGKKLYHQGKYLGAIAQYNKALLLARLDKPLAALFYGNRSAVYMELRYFKHCLHNIELAEPNFPHDNIQRLHDRRARCLQLMETSVDQSMDAFVHDFQLSYKANPKIPFFIDALEIKKDRKHGKHLITTQNLKAGDVVAVIDKPWRSPVTNLNVDHILGCYTCSDTNNGDLTPGDCDYALFCSDVCKLKHNCEKENHQGVPAAMQEMHPILVSCSRFITKMLDIFGSVAALRQFVDTHRDKDYTVFDFDWSKADDDTRYKNMLLAMVKIAVQSDDFTFFKDINFLKENGKFEHMINDPINGDFINGLCKKILSQRRHCLSMVSDGVPCNIAMFIHPALKLLQEQCDPNVFMHSNRQAVVLTVLHPIKAGSAISFSKLPFYLESSKARNCPNKSSCKPCKNNWMGQVKGVYDDAAGHVLLKSVNHNYKHVSSHLTELKSSADFINKNFEGYYSDETKRRMIVAHMCEMMYTLEYIECPFQNFIQIAREGGVALLMLRNLLSRDCSM